jgi:hypothetical protein
MKARKLSFENLVAPPPNPRDFSLYRQNGWRYNQRTWAEDRALQGWNPSADSRAGMDGAATVAPRKSDLPVPNLLPAQIGLDNRDHFSRHNAVGSKRNRSSGYRA